jgi:transcriptional regulator with XRE-family HTH domain
MFTFLAEALLIVSAKASVPQSEQKLPFSLAGTFTERYNSRRRYSEDHSMERPGERLKRVREKLSLTYRDVEQASRQIAARRGNEEFILALSRLADIENKGTAPSIHRIYTLCAIYRLDYEELLGWYGVPRELLASEAVQIGLQDTHAVRLSPAGPVIVPRMGTCEIDLNKTTFLSYLTQGWGKMPLHFLNDLDLSHYRYGIIGTEDWSMYPILQPGSVLAIDQNKRKIATDGWIDELDRPIYFLEHRAGYCCGWCSILGESIVVQPHPASQQPPILFESQDSVDVIGQVIGVAMKLQSCNRRHKRHSTKV